MPETERCKNVQYIRLTKEKQFEIIRGRHTVLSSGVLGIVLTENVVDELINLNEKERKKCLEVLSLALESGQTPAFIQGFPCVLELGDFILAEAPKSYSVPGEIL